jgi:hypothetical protein
MIVLFDNNTITKTNFEEGRQCQVLDGTEGILFLFLFLLFQIL